MENRILTKELIFGLSLLIGLTVLGVFIFKGLKTFSDKDRIVTVKGLAEMDITATSAFISLDFSFSGDNLQEIIKQTETKKNTIITYLLSVGYNRNDIKVRNTDITDQQRYYDTEWQNGKQVKTKIDRYTTTQFITIQSKDIPATEEQSSKIKLDLISKDLTSTVSTSYSFPELNSIKPKLIAESTKNARVAGEQFANDSKATLGKIKTASQGQITIVGKHSYDEDSDADSRMSGGSYTQKVRVVSTIVFFLE